MKFPNARIIGANTDPKVYRTQPAKADGQFVKRGDLEYVMGRSDLMAFARCPHGWLHGAAEEDDETKSTEWGSLIDCLVLTPGQFDRTYAIYPETYPGAKGEEKPWSLNANYCKDWHDDKESLGLTCIKKGEYDAALRAVKVLAEDPIAWEFISCSARQVMATAEYHDEQTGIKVPLKILLDLVPAKDHPRFGKSLGDFKTTQSAALRQYAKSVYNYNYDAQCGLYLPLYVAATGEDRVDFRHILQENSPPFEVGRRLISMEYLDVGAVKISFALRYYSQCLAHNRWPGYDDDARELLDGFSLVQPESWMLTSFSDLPNIPNLAPVVKPPDDFDTVP